MGPPLTEHANLFRTIDVQYGRIPKVQVSHTLRRLSSQQANRYDNINGVCFLLEYLNQIAWFTKIVFVKVYVCTYLPIYVCPYTPT